MFQIIWQCLKILLKSSVAVVVILLTARFFRVSQPFDDWIDLIGNVYSKLNGSVPVPMEATTLTVIPIANIPFKA